MILAALTEWRRVSRSKTLLQEHRSRVVPECQCWVVGPDLIEQI